MTFCFNYHDLNLHFSCRDLWYEIAITEAPTIELAEDEVSLAGSFDWLFIAYDKSTETKELAATLTMVCLSKLELVRLIYKQ